MDACALGIGKRRQFYTPFEVSQHNTLSVRIQSHAMQTWLPSVVDSNSARRSQLTKRLLVVCVS
jgi:hypothetical protein